MDKDVLAELDTYIAYYPQVSVFKKLRLKLLYDLSDPRYARELRDTALSVSDRNDLFHFIHLENVIEAETESAKEVKVAETEKLDVKDAEALDKESAKELDDERIDETVEVAVRSQNTSSKESPEDILKESQEEIRSTTPELESVILTQAIDDIIQMEVQNETDEHARNEEIAVEEIKTESSSEGEAKSFTDWINLIDSGKTISPISEEPLASPNELIERFLAKKITKIKPIKKDADITSAKDNSLLENSDFATETLASVYATQGKYQKAIEIYNQLILKNPEKKTFFASRIRFLEEKINNI